MKNFIKYLSLIIWITLITLSCNPGNKTTLLHQFQHSIAIEKIDSIGNELIKTGKALGFSIAVMHKSNTLYAKGFGFRDINRTKPFTSGTIFQIASVSKFITSVAILKLVDKGKLSLYTKVSDILPAYPNQHDAERITIRHLLNHTSGIREYGFIADSLLANKANNIDSKVLLDLFNHLPSAFEPGSNFSYSNSGFLLLSLIIEEVSGKSYRDFVKEEVFTALGLETMDTWKNNADQDNVSFEFVLDDSTFTESKYNAITWLLGDGGLSSNCIELAKLSYFVFADGLLSKSLINEMLESPTLKNGASSDYGLGVRKGELFGEPVWGHTGGGSTTTNVLAWYPNSEIAIAVQVNTDNTPLNAIEIESQLLPIIFGDRILGIDTLKLDNEQLREYEGFFSESPRYPHQKRTISTYVHSDGNLYRKRKETQSIGQKLIPAGSDAFAPENYPLDRVVFDRDDTGNVVAMKDYYNGHFMGLRNREGDTTDFNLPEGYSLFDKIQGDLDGDGLDDYALIVKGTNEEYVVKNRFDEMVDRNRRGILIYLTGNGEPTLVTKNLNCFSSENEDGGVYYPPELSIEMEKGKLYIHYNHGRYGYWKYTFRYQNADLELIGYDSSQHYGPIINRETSINFLTKKKLTRENVNQDTEESGDEVFEETWEDIDIKKLYRLAEIADFDDLNVNKEN